MESRTSNLIKSSNKAPMPLQEILSLKSSGKSSSGRSNNTVKNRQSPLVGGHPTATMASSLPRSVEQEKLYPVCHIISHPDFTSTKGSRRQALL
jgi:hypothetical protein